MQPFEKLGAFYLGREYDLASGERLDHLIMYDAHDLTTHAVCLGMTGSGKTGLCIDLLEEAAIDNVPAILIDPKGDLTNLLLTFPELRSEDFEPWVNVDDARRKGMTVSEYARYISDVWHNGLADWGQGPERIRMLEGSADFRIHTPGSEAGLPISILASFKAPALSWDDHEEALREQIQDTVSALLELVGIEADPLRSREHILLSNIFEHFWRRGEDLDLARLITAIQSPPVRQLGVFDVDTFFPEKDRFELAMTLNGIIAAPGFEAWIKGEPLDIADFLYTPSGKPRHSIFYIAHLSDAERMFFVTLLLEQILTWVRQQPGSTSLRALLYFDEVFGFFPPVAKPPSKRPLLTLLKQARAFGFGVVLTTQNPVDLDYKGLTNAGTRFITRWAMSYLRGPLTRSQVRQLMAPVKAGAPVTTPAPARPTLRRQVSPVTVPTLAAPETPVGYTNTPPTLPPNLPQVFLPVSLTPNRAIARLEEELEQRVEAEETALVYEPCLLALGQVGFVARRRDVNESKRVGLLVHPGDVGAVIRWEDADPIQVDLSDLEDHPEPEALFGPVPSELNTTRELKAFGKDFGDYLYHEKSLELDRLEARLAREEQELEEDRAEYEARKREEATAITEKWAATLDEIETYDAQRQLVLDEELPVAGPTRVRVIILLPEEADIDEMEWLRAAATKS